MQPPLPSGNQANWQRHLAAEIGREINRVVRKWVVYLLALNALLWFAGQITEQAVRTAAASRADRAARAERTAPAQIPDPDPLPPAELERKRREIQALINQSRGR